MEFDSQPTQLHITLYKTKYLQYVTFSVAMLALIFTASLKFLQHSPIYVTPFDTTNL